MDKTINIILVAILIGLGLIMIEINQIDTGGIFGSTTVGNDYSYVITTSTVPSNNFLKGSGGSFGSVTITKAGIAGGSITIKDASTTAGILNKTIAIIPSDLVAGTYIFDADFKYGLLLEAAVGANIGTTTYTWR